MTFYLDSELEVSDSASKDVLLITKSSNLARRINGKLGGYYPSVIEDGAEPLFHLTRQEALSLRPALGKSRMEVIARRIMALTPSIKECIRSGEVLP